MTGPTEKRTGRRPKVPCPTAPQMAEVLAAASNGSSEKVCQMLIGVSHTTWFRWQEEAEKGRQPYRDFRDKIDRAKATMLDRCAQAVVAGVASGRVTEIAAVTRTFPDGTVEVIRPARTIREPGDPSVALKVLRVKDSEWREQAAAPPVAAAPGADSLTDYELGVYRALMGDTAR